MSQRSFGSDIGNTSLMTAADSSPSLLQNTTEQTEKPENGHAASTRLPKPLAIEIYTKIHNSTFTKEDLMDEIEDLVDEKFYAGEVLLSQGKEYTVVSSEKRGELTRYIMEDGTKIGQRALKRPGGLTLKKIQQIVLEDVELVWKIKKSVIRQFRIPYPEKAEKEYKSIGTSPNGPEAPLKKSPNSLENTTEQMEKPENGHAASTRLPRPLAIKIYKHLHNCPCSINYMMKLIEKFMKGNDFSSGITLEQIQKDVLAALEPSCKVWLVVLQEYGLLHLAPRPAVFVSTGTNTNKVQDVSLEDTLPTSNTLDCPTRRLKRDGELLKCMEINQYFVSMRKILLWNENISAEQLRDDLHRGLEGFRRSTYKMIVSLLETALQEKEFEKVAHCNARLSEFPITEHTVSELVHAFFIGNTETSFKRDAKKQNRMAGYVMEEDSGSEAEEEAENGEKSTENGQKPEENDPENGHNEPKTEENEPADPEDPEDSEEVIRRQRILALFQNPAHIYEWAPAEQLEVLYELKELVHDLPIIREWYLRDANTEQLTGLKAAANKIAKEIEDFQQQLSDLPPGEITEYMSRHQTRKIEKVIKKRQNLEKALDDLRDELEENREKSAPERDDLERIYRVISIGNDRHLRKYYWFAYSTDAGIWVQDFGRTPYEKWVRECREKGFMDVETMDVENRPEYEDLFATSSSESTANEQNREAPVVSKFQGPFGSLKQTMMDFLRDYQQSGITKIGDLQVFEGRLLDANNLDEMKRLFIELVTSIPKECLIEKYEMGVEKCFSHLIIPRFCRRVEEAKNPSCLHMLLAYFDTRIDRERTLPELPCQVCRRKNGRALLCKKCATVYHYNCHRPAISPALFEEKGFKERHITSSESTEVWYKLVTESDIKEIHESLAPAAFIFKDSLKRMLKDFLKEYQHAGFAKLGDLALFYNLDERILNANTLHKTTRLLRLLIHHLFINCCTYKFMYGVEKYEKICLCHCYEYGSLEKKEEADLLDRKYQFIYHRKLFFDHFVGWARRKRQSEIHELYDLIDDVSEHIRKIEN